MNLCKFLLPLFLLSPTAISASDQTIVKLTPDTDVILLRKDNVSDKAFLNEIKTRTKGSFEIKDTFSGIFNGYLVSLPKSTMPAFKQSDNVEFIKENKFYKVDKSALEVSRSQQPTQIEKINNAINDFNLINDSKRGEGVVIAILDSSFDINHECWATLDETKLSLKLSETDVNQAIANHDFKGKGKYFNNKIVYTYDYGGSAKLNSEGGLTPFIEDDDVFDEYDTVAHGQHTASTALGNGEYTGVAPNAQAVLMKVFTDVDGVNSGCFESQTLKALNDCALLGVDIVSMSYGSILYEFDDTDTDRMYKKLSDKGIFCCESAGNEGHNNFLSSGLYSYISTEQVELSQMDTSCLNASTFTIGASTIKGNKDDVLQFSVDGTMLRFEDQVIFKEGSDTQPPIELPFTTLLNEGETRGAIPYVMVPGLGKAEDYVGLDVTDKIAVVSRGDTTFAEKIAEAKKNGAIGCIIYNNDGLGSLGGFDLSTALSGGLIPTLRANKCDADVLAAAENKVLSFGIDPIGSYTSDGAGANLRVKPDFASPGTNIYAAVANYDEDYAYLTGTSMGCPNFAGALACAISDLDSKENLEAKLRTTAEPYVQINDAFSSIRRQGSGLVNETNLLEGMFLTYKENGQGKIELGNNDDIMGGKVSFDVVIHNPKHLIGTYDGQLSVMTPALYEADPEAYPEYAGVKFQSVEEDLLDLKHYEVVLTGDETQEFHVEYELSKEDKDEISSYFPNGTFVEGYFQLKNDDLPKLSIPYLGFFGDYGSQSCVEDFDFERKEGVIYQSDLLNHFCSETGFNKVNANYNSTIVYSHGGLEGFDVDDIISNDNNPVDQYGAVQTEFIDNKWHIYAGADGVADTISLFQFVNRSVLDNTLTLTNSKGDVVLTDHMFDPLYGPGSEAEAFPLAKSLVTLTDLNYGDIAVIATRAYTILPLADYPDGTYTMKLEYKLTAGYIQTKEYVLHIKHSAETPTFSLGVDENKNFTISFNEKMTKFNLNGEAVTPADNEGTFDYNINLGSLQLTDNIQFNVQAANYATIKGLISQDGKSIIFSNELLDKYLAKTTITAKDGGYSVGFTVANSKKIVVKFKEAPIYALLASYLDPSFELTSIKDSKGNDVPFVNENGVIVFSALDTKFTFSSSSTTSSSEPAPVSSSSTEGGSTGSGGCGGNIASTTLICLFASLFILSLSIIYRRKKEN